MILSCHILNAQNKITGKITGQDSLPLPGATIFVPELNKGTMADQNGNYTLLNLPNGKVKIQYSFIGCGYAAHQPRLTPINFYR